MDYAKKQEQQLFPGRPNLLRFLYIALAVGTFAATYVAGRRWGAWRIPAAASAMVAVLVGVPLLWLSSYYSASLVAGSYASEFASITGINPFLEQALAALIIVPIYIATIWLFSGSQQKHLAGAAAISLLVFSYYFVLYVSTRGMNFDPVTGQVRQWYYMSPDGYCEFFPRDGYHPKYGDKLRPVTGEVAKACEARERARSVRGSRSSSTDTPTATWSTINRDLPVAVASWTQDTTGWLAKYWPLLLVAGPVPLALLRLRGGGRTIVVIVSLALIGWLAVASWREGARTLDGLASTMTELLRDCGGLLDTAARSTRCAGFNVGQALSRPTLRTGEPPARSAAYTTMQPSAGFSNEAADPPTTYLPLPAPVPATGGCPSGVWNPGVGEFTATLEYGQELAICVINRTISINKLADARIYRRVSASHYDLYTGRTSKMLLS